MRERRIALSPPRRLLTDLSHLSRGFPRATLLTRIDGDGGEKALFLGRLKAPDTATVPNLATRMLALKTAPIDSIADFRRALAIARLPLPLRLLLVWLSLNIGRQVPNFTGSFAISALGSHGAAIVGTIPVWSSFLNYGPIAPDGGVDIYLSVETALCWPNCGHWPARAEVGTQSAPTLHTEAPPRRRRSEDTSRRAAAGHAQVWHGSGPAAGCGSARARRYRLKRATGAGRPRGTCDFAHLGNKRRSH
jgi:hypothetical protein